MTYLGGLTQPHYGAARRTRRARLRRAGLIAGRDHNIRLQDSNGIRNTGNSYYGHIYALQREFMARGWPCWGAPVMWFGAGRGFGGVGMGPDGAGSNDGSYWTSWGTLRHPDTGNASGAVCGTMAQLAADFGGLLPTPTFNMSDGHGGAGNDVNLAQLFALACYIRSGGGSFGGNFAAYRISAAHPVGVNNDLIASAWHGGYDKAAYGLSSSTMPFIVRRFGGGNTVYGSGNMQLHQGTGAATGVYRSDISVAAGTRNVGLAILPGYTGTVGSGSSQEALPDRAALYATQLRRPFASLDRGWCLTPYYAVGGKCVKHMVDEIVNSSDLQIDTLLRLWREPLGDTEAQRNIGSITITVQSWQNELSPTNAVFDAWGSSNKLNTSAGIRDCCIAMYDRIRSRMAANGWTTEVNFEYVMGHRHTLVDTADVDDALVGPGYHLLRQGAFIDWVRGLPDGWASDPAHPDIIGPDRQVIDAGASDTAHLYFGETNGYPLQASRLTASEIAWSERFGRPRGGDSEHAAAMLMMLKEAA